MRVLLTCLQIDEQQQMKTQRPFEVREPMRKEQYLIDNGTNNESNSRLSEYHWDTKSNELRQLQNQVY